MNAPYTRGTAANARDLCSHRSSPKEEMFCGHESRDSLSLEDLYGSQQTREKRCHRSFSSRSRGRSSPRRHSTDYAPLPIGVEVERRQDRYSASCSRINDARGRQRSQSRRSQRRRSPSNRSCYTEFSESSVSFSSTKLGQLLSQEGFKFERDFEVESISPEFVRSPPEQRPVLSPRSALSRRYCHPQGPKPNPRNLMQNDELERIHDRGSGKISPPARNSNCRPKTPTVQEFSKTKLGKMLSKRGLTVNNKLPQQKDKKHADPLGNNTAISTCEAMPQKKEERKVDRAEPPSDLSRNKISRRKQEEKSLLTEVNPANCEARLLSSSDRDPPSLSGSETAPTTYSDASGDSATAKHPMEEEPSFIPIQDRIPVEVLKARMIEKAAKKKDIIDKIKSLDAKLSSMLTACHEASRKLKMMDKTSGDSCDVSEISDFSESSLSCGQIRQVSH